MLKAISITEESKQVYARKPNLQIDLTEQLRNTRKTGTTNDPKGLNIENNNNGIGNSRKRRIQLLTQRNLQERILKETNIRYVLKE